MTRVSENSIGASLKFALGKAKSKMEDLQLKGSTLKQLMKPSDNPISNVEILNIQSRTNDNNQFVKNASLALLQLNVSEQAVEQLTDILVKAKEIAIAQSSDFYGSDVRKNVANEIIQLRNQALAIANKRIGQRYIFSGFKTLTQPFNSDGSYNGDKKHIQLEVSRDFFVPINIHGEEVFFTTNNSKFTQTSPLEQIQEEENLEKTEVEPSRDLASENNNNGFEKVDNIFSLLESLSNALENNDPSFIQELLEKFDSSISRLITLRTRIGSISNSIELSSETNKTDNVEGAARKSKLMDADIAELFSDITQQQAVLETTYKSSQGLLNSTLLDFIR